MIISQCHLNSSRHSLRVLSVAVNQWRNNTLWATKRKPKTSVDFALDYYDTVYGPLFGSSWPSIRLALLSPHKYCAVVNNFSNFDEICLQLQNEGAVNIREAFEAYTKSKVFKIRQGNRKKEEKHIYNLDAKIEQIAASKQDEELEQIYPEGAERLSTARLNSTKSDDEEDLQERELVKLAKRSLDVSLAQKSIDTDRQIDPSEGLSSTRLNEFVPVSKLKGKEGFVSEAEHFSFYNEPNDFPVTVEPENTIHFPSHLKVYAFDQGDITNFSSPKTGSTGVMNYYLMDAASVLPVLALGLRPGDRVLDMCAGPGGKSLLCLQTLYPELLVCNDIKPSRINRLHHVLNTYFYDWEEKVKILNTSGEKIEDSYKFSKILVDVPCTTDRHSAMEVDNNIFKPSRNKERIMLPQLQVNLLFSALKLVQKGGSVVYSTCSLNPAQNDGVVQMALRKIWEETSRKIIVKDLSEALEPTRAVFRFADPRCLRYGSLVVPYLPSNFGPMYFCKMERKE